MRWLLIAFVVVFAGITILISFYYLEILMPNTSTTIPKFKIKEIFPTKQDGREWFINMDNPTGDGIFDPGSPISKQPDGSWQIEGRQTNTKFGNEVRMPILLQDKNHGRTLRLQ